MVDTRGNRSRDRKIVSRLKKGEKRKDLAKVFSLPVKTITAIALADPVLSRDRRFQPKIDAGKLQIKAAAALRKKSRANAILRRDAAIVEKLKAGETTDTVAAQANMHPTTITAIVKRRGVGDEIAHAKALLREAARKERAAKLEAERAEKALLREAARMERAAKLEVERAEKALLRATARKERAAKLEAVRAEKALLREAARKERKFSERKHAERNKAIAKAVEAGETAQALSVRYRLAASTITCIVTGERFKTRPLSDRNRQIVQMLLNGETAVEVGAKIGLGHWQVYRIGRSCGISVRMGVRT